eukprot:jgi/Botrbrau1/19894/Bobra.0059s0015.1
MAARNRIPLEDSRLQVGPPGQVRDLSQVTCGFPDSVRVGLKPADTSLCSWIPHRTGDFCSQQWKYLSFNLLNQES